MMYDEERETISSSSLTIKNKRRRKKKEEEREIGIKRERERGGGVKTFDPTFEFAGKVLKTLEGYGWKNLSNRDRNRRI